MSSVEPDRSARGRALPALLAVLLAGTALGGCLFDNEDPVQDGGIGGTGIGSTQSEGPGDAFVEPTAPGPDESAATFTNNEPSGLGGIDATLRAVNLAAFDVTLSVEDTVRDTVPAGSIGRPVSLDTVRARALSIAGDDAVLARIDATLGAGSLTTLVVHAGADDAAVVSPLRTRATTDDAGVALVRVAYATGPARAAELVDAFSLVPAGDAPGASEAAFPAGTEDSIASGYVAVGAGDYALARDGAEGLPLSFAGGEVYTLLFSEGADGRERLLTLIDGDFP